MGLTSREAYISAVHTTLFIRKCGFIYVGVRPLLQPSNGRLTDNVTDGNGTPETLELPQQHDWNGGKEARYVCVKSRSSDITELIMHAWVDFFTGNVTASCAGKGRLVIVGSGIRCAGQFTTEAISHIKNADKVLYFVSDPVTETYIRDLFPGAMDLGVFFDGSKDRYDSCVQMAEACLFFARQGLYTVAIFPGHPGISSLPSLRAMQIAKKQGRLLVCVFYTRRT